MAEKSRTELLEDQVRLFPDNTSGRIVPSSLRNHTKDIVDSAFIKGVDQLTSLELATGAVTEDKVGASAVSHDKIEASMRAKTVATVAAMKAVSYTGYSTNEPINLLGYYSAGDGGGGILYVDKADTTTADNGVTVFVASDGTRLKRPTSSVINLKQAGANGDFNGTTGTDDTARVLAAIAALPAGGGVIYAPSGDYLITNELLIAKNYVNIVGDGRGATIITFNPGVANKTLLTLDKDGDPIVRCTLRDFSVRSTDVTNKKTALHLIDQSECAIQRVRIEILEGGGSVGLLVEGREMLSTNDVSIRADFPIVIEVNPNEPVASCDSFSFHNTLCYTTANNYAMTINSAGASTFTLYNFSVTGYFLAIWGAGGIKFDNSAATGPCYNICVRNMRWELGAATGSMLRIIGSATGPIFNLQVDSSECAGSATLHGVYVNNVLGVQLNSYIYSGTGKYLEIGGGAYSDRVVMINPILEAGSTAVLGSLVEEINTPSFKSWNQSSFLIKFRGASNALGVQVQTGVGNVVDTVIGALQNVGIFRQ